MFRNRKPPRKLDEDLVQQFKKTFPHVVATAEPESSSMSPNAINQAMDIDPYPQANDELRLSDPTPRGLHDIRFTPSVLDHNSFHFTALANPPPDYGNSTPNGIHSMLAHSQAGDLHSPPLGLNMTNSLSVPNGLPTALSNLDSRPDIHLGDGFHNPSQHLLSHHFHSVQSLAQPTGLVPDSFVPRDAGFNPMDSSEDGSIESVTLMQDIRTNGVAPAATLSTNVETSSAVGREKFRYAVTLRAPTAMIKHPDEIPVTYLNKGQSYSISIVDTKASPHASGATPLRYRTYIRVSFDDEQQRSRPAACWQLWKEGRGLNEAHQRGGKLQAVEYVDSLPSNGDRPQVELESTSFDGFSVTWGPNPTTGASDCSVTVRFNFLSTDFSHSKGVKGIPVRLCAKTEVLEPDEARSATIGNAEISYCKVKLFRDHGAERKLTNDVSHVKKSIEKLKQQIAQLEAGNGNNGKRKRNATSIAVKAGPDSRPTKAPKHDRSWSMESENAKTAPEEDLHIKLTMLESMFSSPRPVSAFCLRGDAQDDPDAFPVILPGDAQDAKLQSLSRRGTLESLQSIDFTSETSNALSPSNSATSLTSLHGYAERQFAPEHGQQGGMDLVNGRAGSGLLTQPVKIQRVGRDGLSGGYIEAVDLDPTYRPPAERPPKPIACFYIRFSGKSGEDDYYRAVYLSQRTVRDLMYKISEKQCIDPDRIVRVLRINENGLKIMVDDDVVQHLPEGQDMVAEITEASKLKVNTPSDSSNTPALPVEVKLTY